MITKNILNRYLALAMTCLFTSAAVWAVEPVAVWYGDFGQTNEGYKLKLNGNTAERGIVTIADKPILVDFDSAHSGITVLINYSSFTAASENVALFTVKASDAHKDATGFFAGAEKMGGIWEERVWGTAQINVALPTGDNSHQAIFRYSTGGGSYMFFDGATTSNWGSSNLKSAGYSANGIALGGSRSNNLAAATGMKITGIAIFDGALDPATINQYAFPEPAKLLVNFSKTEPTTPAAGWIDWGYLDKTYSTLQGPDDQYIGAEEGPRVSSTANGNFRGAETSDVANDFQDGTYTDIFGQEHTSIINEVKASLGLDASVTFDETVYKSGLMNGGHSEHTVTISNLVPQNSHVIYLGFGRVKADDNNQTCGVTIPTQGAYSSIGAIEYVATVAGNNTSVATTYTAAEAGVSLKPGSDGLLIVRLTDVVPTSKGEIKFKFTGDRGGINFLAVKEFFVTSTSETWNGDISNTEPIRVFEKINDLTKFKMLVSNGGLTGSLGGTSITPEKAINAVLLDSEEESSLTYQFQLNDNRAANNCHLKVVYVKFTAQEDGIYAVQTSQCYFANKGPEYVGTKVDSSMTGYNPYPFPDYKLVELILDFSKATPEADNSSSFNSGNNTITASSKVGGAPFSFASFNNPTYTNVRGTSDDKAFVITDSVKPYITSNILGNDDFSFLTVAKIGASTETAPRVISYVGCNTSNGTGGLALVAHGKIIKLVNFTSQEQNDVLISSNEEISETQFHSYLVTCSTENKVQLYIDGVAVSEEPVALVTGVHRGGTQLGSALGYVNYIKVGDESCVVGTGIEIDEYAIWHQDVGEFAASIAIFYPVWPNLISHEATGDISVSDLITEYGSDIGIDLTMPEGSTLTIDQAVPFNLIVNSTGTVSIKSSEEYQFTLDDIAYIEAGTIEGLKFVFTSVPEGLAAPAAGIIYRFESETELSSLPLSTLAVNGEVEVAAPIATQNKFELANAKTNYVLDDGFSVSATTMQLGNHNCTQTLTQKTGSSIEVTGTAVGTGSNDTGTSVLFAHYPSTVTYNMLGGEFTAAKIVQLGWDGKVYWNIGCGDDPSDAAVVTVSGIRGRYRYGNQKGASTMTLGPQGTLKLGSDGIDLYTDTNQKTFTLAGGKLIATASSEIKSEQAVQISAASTIEVLDNVTLTISAALAGEGAIIKTGEGVLDIGTNRPTIDVQAGHVKLTLLTEELIAGELVLTVPENAADADKSKISIVDSEGNDVVISEVTKEGTTLTVTLDSGVPIITDTKSISELQLDSELEGILIIQGADSSEGRFTVTFDEELPEGVEVLVVGYADLAGDYIPNTKLSFKSGANVTMSTFTGTIDTGITITAESATGTITNNGTLNLTGESEFTLINTGIVNFKSGANASVSAANEQSIRGKINVEKGATFINVTDDAIPYAGDPVTLNVYGTLQMGETRWTIGSTDIINLYGGCTIIGTNEGNGNLDLYHLNDVINVIKVDGEATTVEVGRIRSRKGAANNNEIPPGINVDEGMTLVVNGGIGASSEVSHFTKNGAGNLTIKSGLWTSEFSIAAGTVTLDTSTGDFPMKANFVGTPSVIGTGTIKFSDGSSLDLGTGTPTQTARYVVESGTATLKMRKENQTNIICENDSAESPLITVNTDAVLNFSFKDLSGWGGNVLETGWIKNNGTLKLTSNGGTMYFRNHLILAPGSTTSLDDTSKNLIVYGGNSDKAKAQIVVPSSATAATAALTGEGIIQIGSNGAAWDIGANSTLEVSNKIIGSEKITKYGEGTLKLTNVENTFSGELEINGGAVELDDCTLSVSKLSGQGSVSGSGYLTVTEEFAGVKAVEGMLILADGVKITSENKTEVVAITFGNSLKIKAMPGDVIFESYWGFAATLPTITLIDANGNDISGDYSLLVQEVPDKDHYWQIVIDNPNQQVPTISGVGNNLSEILAANPGAYKIKLTEKTGTELVIDTDENLPSILDILPGDEEGEYELTILYKKEFRNITLEDGVTVVNKKLHYTLNGENPWPAMTIHAGEVVTLVGGDTEETRLVHAGMITIEEGGSLSVEGLVTIPTVYEPNGYTSWKSDAVGEEGTIEINKVVKVDGFACWVDYEFNGNCNSEGSSDSAMNFEGNGFSQDEGDAYGYKEIEEGNKAIYVGATPWSGLNINSKAVWSAAIYGTLPRYDKAVFLGIGGRPTIDTGKNIDIINGSGDNSVQLVKIDGTTLTTLVDLYVYEAHTKPHLYVIIKKADSLEFYVDGKLRGTVNEAIEIDPGLQIGAIYQGVSMGLQKFTKSLFGDDLNNETLRAAYVDALRVYDYALSSAAISALTTEFPYEAPESESFVRLTGGDSLWVEENAWSKGAETFDTPNKNAAVEIPVTSTLSLNLESDLTIMSLTIGEGSDVTIKKSDDFNGKLNIVDETIVEGDFTIEHGAVDINYSKLTIAEGGSLTFDFSKYPISTTLNDTLQVTGITEKLEEGKINLIKPSNLYGREMTLSYNSAKQVYEVKVGVFREAQEVIWDNSSKTINYGGVVRLMDGTPSAFIDGDTLIIADQNNGSFNNAITNLALVITNANVKVSGNFPTSVRIDEDGVYDVNGRDNTLYSIILNGGTLANFGNATLTNHVQCLPIEFTKDSYIETSAFLATINSGWNDATFKLNGHKLTKRGGDKYQMCNATLVGGGTIEVEEGTFEVVNGFVVNQNETVSLIVDEGATLTLSQGSDNKVFVKNGTLNVENNGKIVMNSGVTPIFDSITGSGTVEFAAMTYSRSSLIPLDKYGNENSTIVLNGLSGNTYLGNADTTISSKVVVNGNVIFNQGSSNKIYTFKCLTGEGDLTLSNWTGCSGITYNIDNLEDYTGTLAITNVNSNAFNFNIGNIKAKPVYGEPLVKLVRNETVTYTAENTTVNGSAAKLELAEDGIYLIAATYNDTDYRTLSEAIEAAGNENLQDIHVYDMTTDLGLDYVRVKDEEGNVSLHLSDNVTISANTAVSSWSKTANRLIIEASEGDSLTVTFDAEVPENLTEVIFSGDITVVQDKTHTIQLSKVNLADANLTIKNGTISESFVSPNPIKLVGTVTVDTELNIAEGATLSFSADSAATLKFLKSKSGKGAVSLTENITLYIPEGVQVLNVKGTGKVDGAGLISNEGALSAIYPVDNWIGTYWLKNISSTPDGGFPFDNYANTDSKLMLTGLSVWLSQNKDYKSTLVLKDEGDVLALTLPNTSNNWWHGLKLAGDGTLKLNTTADTPMRLMIKECSEFSGNVIAGNRPIYFGSTGDNTTTGIIVVHEGVSVNVAKDKTWTATNGITINGTIKGSGTLTSNTTFGSEATIDCSEGYLTLGAAVTFAETINVKGAKLGDTIIAGVSPWMQVPIVTARDIPGEVKLAVSNGKLVLVSDEVSFKIPTVENTTLEVTSKGEAIPVVDGMITVTSGTEITVTYKPISGYVGGGSLTTTVVNGLTPIRTDLISVKKGVKVIIREYKGAMVKTIEGLDGDGIATGKVIINGNEHSLDGAVDGVLIIELKP